MYTIRSHRASKWSRGQTRNKSELVILVPFQQFIIQINLPFPIFRVRKKLRYSLQNTLEILCDILQQILERCLAQRLGSFENR